MVSNKLLDREVADAGAFNVNTTASASTIVRLSDGWTSVKGKASINFMAACDRVPIYPCTIDTKADMALTWTYS